MAPFKLKFASKLLLLPFLVLLLFSRFTDVVSETDVVDDLDGIQELIAIDNELESGLASDPTTHFEGSNSGKKSEAEVLSKAQRIVLELNIDNAKRVIEENEYVLVLGYAPWDGGSADLMPRFAEAATILKSLGSELLMAKIDTERHPKAASSLGIKGLPTLLLFVNGTSQSYTGGFSREEIMTWARKKTGLPVIRINSVAEADEFLRWHSTYAVGLFDKFEGSEYDEFYKAAVADSEIQFVELSSLEVAKTLYPDPAHSKARFFLVKSVPEHYTALDGSLSKDLILNFLEDNKLPLVTVMTELNSAKLYSRPEKKQVYFFAEINVLNKVLDQWRDIAKKFKSQIMFIAVDINNDHLAKPYLSLFGLQESKETVVVAFDYNSNSKYLLESSATPSNIEDFCTSLAQESLLPFYKSQPIPEKEDGNILTIVGRSFDQLVLRNPKNIMLEVHTPWCITCEATSKKVQKVAKHFEGLDKLIFARFDASENEHPILKVEDYPTLLFYPVHDKSNPIKLPAKSSLKELAVLINKNLKLRDSKDEL